MKRKSLKLKSFEHDSEQSMHFETSQQLRIEEQINSKIFLPLHPAPLPARKKPRQPLSLESLALPVGENRNCIEQTRKHVYSRVTAGKHQIGKLVHLG
ncbi:hypothetical protein T07_7739 [Trichinella nelsoni]|uniref:Uncharacterized protein n=1 Tax=Trichinella nelsoni TaxID=6336 RepID=A0A0V0RJU1_9BILA|nr:hypothetical protein T07_7739 [Trichinella nelsoni]